MLSRIFNNVETICNFLIYINPKGGFLIQIHHGDTCSAKLHMLVFEVAHIGYGVEVLADELAQDACARAVEDAHPRHAHQDGVVDEVHHGIYGLVAAHASHVDVLVEVLFAVFHRGACHLRCLHGQVGILRCQVGFFLLRLACIGTLQLFQFHLRAHIAKDNGDLLALYALDGAHGVEALDAHGIALLEG